MNPIGAVFTPRAWALWAVERMDAAKRVAEGATICDPTAGEGAFAEALAELWSGPSGTVDQTWARRITLVEREPAFLETFARRWRNRWGFSFPEKNLVCTDVVTDPPDRQFDLAVGNPPWVTYPDLDDGDQTRYRSWFSRLGLVGKPSELLLGRSRLDLAALVTARVFGSLLTPEGRAGFFLPLSLFHNEGTPSRWRRWTPDQVYDLTECRPFPGVSTRCGWAEFTPGRSSGEPKVIPYFVGAPGAWTSLRAVSEGEGTPWRVLGSGFSPEVPRFSLPSQNRPRQGVNTGGANAAFHLEAPPKGVDPAYVHPLATGLPEARPTRWILVPYDREGKLLDAEELARSGLGQFWAPWKEKLAARKGVLLGSQLAKGRWWALLGVGPYAFAPYKVIWSAYGKDRLDARVFGPREDGSVWQANQALQAYIPCDDPGQARKIAEFLNSDEVNHYLSGFRAAGTKSWAQPGRLKPLWQT